jgi:hypothetical protein
MITLRAKAAVCLLTLAAAAALTTRATGQEAKLCPPGTEFVFSVNLRQMLESELVKGKKGLADQLKMAVDAQLRKDAEGERYLKELGFEPLRDLDRVTFVGPASPDPAKFLIIIHGRFDTQKFAATAAKAAKDHSDVVSITKAGKHQLIEITPPGEKAAYVALVGGKTLLASQTKATLTGALAQADGERAVELKQTVKDLLAARDKGASVSFLAAGSAIGPLLAAANDPRMAKMMPLAQQIFDKIASINASATLGTDIQLQLSVGTKDAKTAKDLAAQSNVLLALANLGLAKEAQNNPQAALLMDIVKTVQASAQGSSFNVRAQVPAAVAERLLNDALNKR